MPVKASDRDGDAPTASPSSEQTTSDQTTSDQTTSTAPHVAVVFSAPFSVTLEPLSSPSSAAASLAPDELLIKTTTTAVSAGTEMLVYRGRMPPDIATDANLPGSTGAQAAKPFAYPARYGYASVGTVHAAGKDAEASSIIGARVFVFREHASWVIVRAADVMLVPDAVDTADAAFLPNVETAVSLAMDVAPLPGENVAVVGQGIVGLLLVAVLKLCYGQTRVIAVDAAKERLRASTADARVEADGDAEEGVRLALPEGDRAGVDVAVDVSGSGAGLNTAISVTRDGGRVVVGSWFGSREVVLDCLGGRFHRSHISLVASQVSDIPAALTSRWDKERRFRLAWKLLPLIMPSTKFPMHIAPVWEAVSAYDDIDKGKHLQVLFTYAGDGDGEE